MSETLLFLIPGLGYLLAGAAYTFRRLARAERPAAWATGLIYLSLVLHVVLLGVRDYAQPTALFANARELALMISCLLVVAYLITARWLRGIGVSGLVLSVAGLSLLLAVPFLSAQPQPVPEMLRSPWLLLHVPLIMLAYLMYAMAASGAVMYLVVSWLLKARRPVALSAALPTLESLDRFSHRMARAGFPLLTAALIAGMMWSHEVWGQLFPEAPKQMAAFASWGIYAAYFHARNARGTRGRFCAWLLIAGFVAVLIGFLIPIVSGGPHKFM
jgi:ABC-type transport system involved in cytochrome c biogenesis permease subunit